MVPQPIKLKFSVNYLFDERKAEAVEETLVWCLEIPSLKWYTPHAIDE
jgi:hypothetical protein